MTAASTARRGLPLLALGLAALAGCSHAPAPEAYTSGEAVQILWHGSPYAGHVVEIGTDGRYKVHYDGWADSWDEWATLDRLDPPGTSGAPQSPPN